MIFPGQKGLRGGKWVANEQLIEEDINFTTELVYTNLTALLGTLARPDRYGENADIVLGGLSLVHNNLLTCDFSAGITYSFSGYYLSGGTWGFVASAGNLFTVVNPISQSVAFLSGGTFARIDLLEVRPVRTAYDSKNRQFKDPITGLVTGSPIDTKYEYGYQFQVIKGDDTSALTKEQTTWQIEAATVGSDVAGKYVLFSTRSADYYIWYDTGASSDPAVSGRTGIEITVNAGDDDDAIALATRTALSAHLLATTGEVVITGATNQFIITVDFYVNVTDGTNGDMTTYFDTIAITQGHGVVDHTAGWIKIAEVDVGASASAITQNDIFDVRDSNQWQNEPSGTRVRRWPADRVTIDDTAGRFTATEVESALAEIAGVGRTTETVKQNYDDIREGVPYYDLIIDSVADLELLKVGTSDQYPRVLIKHGTYLTSEKLDWYAHGVKYLRGERLETTIKFDTSTNATPFILLDNEGLYECFTVEIIVGGTRTEIIDAQDQVNNIVLKDIKILGTGAGVGEHNGFTYISRLIGTGKGGLINCSVEGCRYGFKDCNNLVNCTAFNMSYDAFYSCEKLTNCVVDGVTTSRYGFYQCYFLSNCFANDAYNGFHMCDFVSSCKSSNHAANGFEQCSYISACVGRDNVSCGFKSCEYVSSCFGTNNSYANFYLGTKIDTESCNTT